MDGTTKRRLLEKRRQKWQIFGWICSHRREETPRNGFSKQVQRKRSSARVYYLRNFLTFCLTLLFFMALYVTWLKKQNQALI